MRIIRGGSTSPGKMEASHKTHRPHIKLGKDAEEEEEIALRQYAGGGHFEFLNKIIIHLAL